MTSDLSLSYRFKCGWQWWVQKILSKKENPHSHFNEMFTYLIHTKIKKGQKANQWYIICQELKTWSQVCLALTKRISRSSSWMSSLMWFLRQDWRNSISILMDTKRDWFEAIRESSSLRRCTENTQTDFTGCSRELMTSGYLRSPNAVIIVPLHNQSTI